MNRLLTYLPEEYHDIIDMIELTETETVEIINAETAVQKLLDDKFVVSASEQGVRRRERMLGIQADPTTESIEFRRRRLINRYSTKPPFTRKYLQEQLDALVGAGMTIVSIDSQEFILTVTTNIDDAHVFREVIHTIETVKPANMLYQQNTSLISKIGIKEHIKKQDITWNYKLDGSWKLGEKPFATFGAEEDIK